MVDHIVGTLGLVCKATMAEHQRNQPVVVVKTCLLMVQYSRCLESLGNTDLARTKTIVASFGPESQSQKYYDEGYYQLLLTAIDK